MTFSLPIQNRRFNTFALQCILDAVKCFRTESGFSSESGFLSRSRDDILDMMPDFVQDEDHSILLSSHITSDLEKIADHIVFIHEGQVVFSKPKDELTEQYGILQCGAAQFDALDKSDVVMYRKRDYE